MERRRGGDNSFHCEAGGCGGSDPLDGERSAQPSACVETSPIDERFLPSVSLPTRPEASSGCGGSHVNAEAMRRERDEAHAQVQRMARRVAALEESLGFKAQALAESRRAYEQLQQAVAAPVMHKAVSAQSEQPAAPSTPRGVAATSTSEVVRGVLNPDELAQALRQALEWREQQAELQSAVQALQDVAAVEADARAEFEAATSAALRTTNGHAVDATIRELEALTSEASARAEYRELERRAGATRRSWLEEERALAKQMEDAQAAAAAAIDESEVAVLATAAARRDLAAERQRALQADDERVRAASLQTAAQGEAALEAARAQIAEAELAALRARTVVQNDEHIREQTAAALRMAELNQALEMARAAWRDERARNEGTERALRSTIDEVVARSSVLEEESRMRLQPTDGAPSVLRKFATLGVGSAAIEPFGRCGPTGRTSHERRTSPLGHSSATPGAGAGDCGASDLTSCGDGVSQGVGIRRPTPSDPLLGAPNHSAGDLGVPQPQLGRSVLVAAGDAAHWERAAIEERLGADRCAQQVRALEFALGAARSEGTRLATQLAERVREAEELEAAMADVKAGIAREREVLEVRARREAEAAELERRRADRACEALQRALVQAGARPASWERKGAEGEPSCHPTAIHGEAWINAAEGELLRWIAAREERVAQLAHDVERARAESRANVLRLTAAVAAESGAADRAKMVSRHLVGALHGAVRDAVDAAEEREQLTADTLRAEGAMLLRTERWRAQAEAANAHNKRLMGLIGSYSVRSHLAMPRAPAAHVAAARGAEAEHL